MSIIGYARVSTFEQTLDLQRDALNAAGAVSIYEDKASGKSADRPELQHCLKALRDGDTLVVWRLDRLGRNLHDLTRIVNDLEGRGVKFRSLKESIDTSDLPPANRASRSLVKFVFGEEDEHEEALYGTANHRVSEGSRGRYAGQGTVQEARVQ
ncbi:recombinase family protein [Burkholderia multivorans]|uniref:recombinase family protein n=2 Tax=Burkholderia multivorans TaxID=87883 RepID=UPI0009BE5AC3